MNLVVVVLSVSMQSSASIPVCGILHNRLSPKSKEVRVNKATKHKKWTICKISRSPSSSLVSHQVSGWRTFSWEGSGGLDVASLEASTTLEAEMIHYTSTQRHGRRVVLRRRNYNIDTTQSYDGLPTTWTPTTHIIDHLSVREFLFAYFIASQVRILWRLAVRLFSWCISCEHSCFSLLRL